MSKKVLSTSIASVAGGLFLLLDQFLKVIARNNPYSSSYIIDPWLGWEYLQNYGIAFGLPVTQFIVVPVSFIIIGGLLIYTIQKHTKTFLFSLGSSLVIWGALSNIIDRMFFGFTTDYIRIISSVINIADIMIVLGASLLVLSEYNEKRNA